MFRVNSTSKQLVRLNVIEAGRSQQVDLLPKNFVFTESVTDQMKMLEKEGVIKVKEAKIVKSAGSNKVQPKPPVNVPAADGKLDFVNDDKIAKVQKKKK